MTESESIELPCFDYERILVTLFNSLRLLGVSKGGLSSSRATIFNHQVSSCSLLDLRKHL